MNREEKVLRETGPFEKALVFIGLILSVLGAFTWVAYGMISSVPIVVTLQGLIIIIFCKTLFKRLRMEPVGEAEQFTMSCGIILEVVGALILSFSGRFLLIPLAMILFGFILMIFHIPVLKKVLRDMGPFEKALIYVGIILSGLGASIWIAGGKISLIPMVVTLQGLLIIIFCKTLFKILRMEPVGEAEQFAMSWGIVLEVSGAIILLFSDKFLQFPTAMILLGAILIIFYRTVAKKILKEIGPFEKALVSVGAILSGLGAYTWLAVGKTSLIPIVVILQGLLIIIFCTTLFKILRMEPVGEAEQFTMSCGIILEVAGNFILLFSGKFSPISLAMILLGVIFIIFYRPVVKKVRTEGLISILLGVLLLLPLIRNIGTFQEGINRVSSEVEKEHNEKYNIKDLENLEMVKKGSLNITISKRPATELDVQNDLEEKVHSAVLRYCIFRIIFIIIFGGIVLFLILGGICVLIEGPIIE